MAFPSPSLTPPTLSNFQGYYNGLTWGAGTAWGFTEIDGWSDSATIRNGDQTFPRDHGEFTGLDVYGGRDITVDYWMKSDGTSLQHAQLALAAATVTQPNTNLPLWLQLPNLPLLCSMCRPRKRTMPIDSDYAAGAIGKPVVQWHANDPRLYAAGAQSTIALNQTPVQNLVRDPSFEYDTLNAAPSTYTSAITAGTGTVNTFLVENAWADSGKQSLRVTLTALSSSSTWLASTPTGLNGIPVTGSTAYSLGGYAYVLSLAAGSAEAYFQVSWYTSAGVFISNANTGFITSTGVHQATAAGLTSPSNAAFASVAAGVYNNTATGTFDGYFDAIQLVNESTLPAYFDGDTSGYAWLSVPGNSTSVPVGSASITNAGNMEMRPIVILNGPLTNPGIGNDTLPGNPQLVWSNPAVAVGAVDVLSGDQMLIDLGTPNRALYYTGGIASGVAGVDVMDWLTGTANWWNLPPGANTIYLFSSDLTTLTGTAYFQYASAYQL